MVRGRPGMLTVLMGVGVICGSLSYAQIGLIPAPAGGMTPVPVPQPKYDFWVTPLDSSFVTLSIPADFFGTGSDPVNEDVALVGEPFGRPGRLHKPPAADTSVRRSGDPAVSQVGDVDTVTISLYALNLVSVAPITVTYYGGTNPQEWDVRVGLSDLSTQPSGTLTATMTFANGGLFDSVLNVIPKLTFTPTAGGSALVLDAGDPQWGLGTFTMQSRNSPFVWCLPSPGGSTECAKFHPGVQQTPCGPVSCWVLAMIREKELKAEHAAKFCIDCIDPLPPIPIDLYEVEPTGDADDDT